MSMSNRATNTDRSMKYLYVHVHARVYGHVHIYVWILSCLFQRTTFTDSLACCRRITFKCINFLFCRQRFNFQRSFLPVKLTDKTSESCFHGQRTTYSAYNPKDSWQRTTSAACKPKAAVNGWLSVHISTHSTDHFRDATFWK
jgi:hypothetical protein